MIAGARQVDQLLLATVIAMIMPAASILGCTDFWCVGGVVLRAANQKSNDCRGQSSLDSSDPALQKLYYTFS
jgi:hypothetical protein